jgi:N-acetylmuramoyl-L-alanine amidase
VLSTWTSRALLAVAVALLLAAVALFAFAQILDHGGPGPATPPSTTTVPPDGSAAPALTSTTTTLPVWPARPDDGTARAVITSTGVVAAVDQVSADGAYLVRTPCGGQARATGTPLSRATVVLDPGHGGDEVGAVGPSGLEEKDVNLAVARDAQADLEALGATVVLTRTGDYRITLASRAAIATSLDAGLLISIHHNADPDGPHDGPGSETYYQVASPASRRAAGLVYQEVTEAFAAYDVAWVGDADAGAKYRRRTDGGDYYGILHGSAGVPAVLSEAAFVTNPPEERLLADPSVQQVEAAAIARAAVRFLTTDDPGSGYIEPYPRTTPAGPGGGATGCVDPPLG